MEFGPGWERKRVTADLGKDQFVHDNNFAVVLEFPVLLDHREDFAELLDLMIGRMGDRLQEVEKEEASYLSADGLGRATRSFTARLGSLDFAYRMDVVGRDGLAYLVMSWGPRTGAEEVYAYGAAFAASLRMPGPETEWGRSALAAPRTVEHQGWTWGSATSARCGATSPRRGTPASASPRPTRAWSCCCSRPRGWPARTRCWTAPAGPSPTTSRE